MKPSPPSTVTLHRPRPLPPGWEYHHVRPVPPRPVLYDQGDSTDVTLTELEARATLRLLESLSRYAGEQNAIHELCDTIRRKLRRPAPALEVARG